MTAIATADDLAQILVSEPCLTEEEARKLLGLPPPGGDSDDGPDARRPFAPSLQ